jgi:hypothetical protein
MENVRLSQNTQGEAVEEMANVLNTMSWEQRFWASWQALVEMEARYEQILARTGSLQPADLKRKRMKPKAMASRMIALQRRRDECAA